MNLDLAIQNVLKRSEMESAMHGVMSNFGNTYQLTSYTESAKAADSILGVPVAHMSPNALSRPTITKKADTYTQADPSGNLSTMIDGFNLTYDAKTKNWTLGQQEKPNFWNNLFGMRPKTKVIVTTYGTNASHRFLTAVEQMTTLSASTKNKIGSYVMTNMRTVSVQSLQQGFTVDTEPIDDAITYSSSAKVLEAPVMNNGGLEMNLASAYSGVSKQKNDTFMGDTVIPTPLTQAQIGMVRTPLGDPVGVHIAPPTRPMGAVRTNRSL
tara:strand:- start:6755 stop:7558 length:804 start_codon:yes stop_codon:yes gene_type:complete